MYGSDRGLPEGMWILDAITFAFAGCTFEFSQYMYINIQICRQRDIHKCLCVYTYVFELRIYVYIAYIYLDIVLFEVLTVCGKEPPA